MSHTSAWAEIRYSQSKERVGKAFKGVFWQLSYPVAGQIPKMGGGREPRVKYKIKLEENAFILY